MGEARHPASSALGRSPRPKTGQLMCASYSSSGWGETPLALASKYMDNRRRTDK